MSDLFAPPTSVKMIAAYIFSEDVPMRADYDEDGNLGEFHESGEPVLVINERGGALLERERGSSEASDE